MQTFGDVAMEEVRVEGSCLPEQLFCGLSLIAVLSGRVQRTSALHLSGDVVVLPSVVNAQMTCSAGTHLVVCAISGTLLRRLRPYVPPGPCNLTGDEVGPLAARLLTELQRPDHATPLFLEAAVCNVMARLARSQSVPALTAPLAAAMRYAADHLAQRITLPELAVAARLSVRALSSRFTAELRLTPLEYVRTLRVRRAAQALLETTHDLALIAEHCGFYDHAHLTRAFHQSMGTTPTEYRRQCAVTGPFLSAAH